MKAMIRVLGALLAFIAVAAVAGGLAIGAVWLLTTPSALRGEVLSVLDPTTQAAAEPSVYTVAPSAGCVTATPPAGPDGAPHPRAEAPASRHAYELPGCATAEDAVAYVEVVFARDAEDIAYPQAEAELRTERFATCAWTLEWLNADTVADAARRDAAASWLADPANRAAVVEWGTGTDHNLLDRGAQAAASGDRALVDEARSRNCEPEMGLYLAY